MKRFRWRILLVVLAAVTAFVLVTRGRSSLVGPQGKLKRAAGDVH